MPGKEGPDKAPHIRVRPPALNSVIHALTAGSIRHRPNSTSAVRSMGRLTGLRTINWLKSEAVIGIPGGPTRPTRQQRVGPPDRMEEHSELTTKRSPTIVWRGRATHYKAERFRVRLPPVNAGYRSARRRRWQRRYRAPHLGRSRVVVIGQARRFCTPLCVGARLMVGDRNAGYLARSDRLRRRHYRAPRQSSRSHVRPQLGTGRELAVSAKAQNPNRRPTTSEARPSQLCLLGSTSRESSGPVPVASESTNRVP